MSKHTPGPWIYYTKPQPNGCPVVGARGLMVAMLAHSINEFDQKDIAIANARLIAAAPDLLDALKDAESELAFHPRINSYVIDKVRAAIAKATGD